MMLTPQEVAKTLKCSPRHVRDTFRAVPGVIDISDTPDRVVLRIPDDVFSKWIKERAKE